MKPWCPQWANVWAPLQPQLKCCLLCEPAWLSRRTQAAPKCHHYTLYRLPLQQLSDGAGPSTLFLNFVRATTLRLHFHIYQTPCQTLEQKIRYCSCLSQFTVKYGKMDGITPKGQKQRSTQAVRRGRNDAGGGVVVQKRHRIKVDSAQGGRNEEH